MAEQQLVGNSIIGYVVGVEYSAAALRRFVETLRASGYRGNIVLALSAIESAIEEARRASFLEKHGVLQFELLNQNERE